MRSLPPFATRDRAIGAVLVVGLGIAQAAALAVAAFATRDAFAALHGGNALTVSTMLALGGSGATAALCLLLSRRQAEALGQSYAVSLRRVLYEQIASLPIARHEQRRVGALSLRFVGDLSAARLWFGRGLPDVLTATVVLPGAVAILVALDPVLAGAGLVPLGLALALMAATAWHLDRRHRQLRRRRATIAIAMIERIAIAPQLDLMGRTDRELGVLDEQGEALKRDAVARRGRTAGLQAILQIGVALAGLTILWLAGQLGTAPATVAASLGVLALVALPLQDLGAAWDRFCAWSVAREKAGRLLAEPTMARKPADASAPTNVSVRGTHKGDAVDLLAPAGAVTRIEGPKAGELARVIAGLDREDGLSLAFDGRPDAPRIAYIGDEHIGIQGSLRRAATLSARRRPKDKTIAKMLSAFDLNDMLSHPEGLDQRIAENGRGLDSASTLRLDLARAVLGEAELIVISSRRWWADPARDSLLATLLHNSPATVIIAETPNHSNFEQNSKAH